MSELKSGDDNPSNGSQNNMQDNILGEHLSPNSDKSECYIAPPLNIYPGNNDTVKLVSKEHLTIVDSEKEFVLDEGNITNENITNVFYEDEKTCTGVISNSHSEIELSIDTLEDHPGADHKNSISDNENTKEIEENEEICTNEIESSNYNPEINLSLSNVVSLVHPTITNSETDKNTTDCSLTEDDNINKTNNFEKDEDIFNDITERPNSVLEESSEVIRDHLNVQNVISLNTVNSLIKENDKLEVQNDDSEVITKSIDVQNNVPKSIDKSFDFENNYKENGKLEVQNDDSEVITKSIDVQNNVPKSIDKSFDLENTYKENDKLEVQNDDSEVITKSIDVQNNVPKSIDKSFDFENNYKEKDDSAFIESSDDLSKSSQENEVNINKDDKTNESVGMESTNDLNTSIIADIQVQLSKMHDNIDMNPSSDNENTVFAGSTANTNVEETSPLVKSLKKNDVSNLETNDDNLFMNSIINSSFIESNIVEIDVNKNDSSNSFKSNASDLLNSTQENAAEFLKNSNTNNSSSTSIIIVDKNVQNVTPTGSLESIVTLNTCTDSVCDESTLCETSIALMNSSFDSNLDITPFPPRNEWFQFIKDFNEFMRKASGFPIITSNQNQKSKCPTKNTQNCSNKKSTKRCNESIKQSSSRSKSLQAISVKPISTRKRSGYDTSNCDSDYNTNPKKKKKITKTTKKLQLSYKSTSTRISFKRIKKNSSLSSESDTISEGKNSTCNALKINNNKIEKKDKSSYSTSKCNKKKKISDPSLNVSLRVSRRLGNKNIFQSTSDSPKENTQSKAKNSKLSHISDSPSKYSSADTKYSQTRSKITPVRKMTLLKSKTKIKMSKLTDEICENSSDDLPTDSSASIIQITKKRNYKSKVKKIKNSSENFSDKSSSPARKKNSLTTDKNDKTQIKKFNSCAKSRKRIWTSSRRDDNELNTSTEEDNKTRRSISQSSEKASKTRRSISQSSEKASKTRRSISQSSEKASKTRRSISQSSEKARYTKKAKIQANESPLSSRTLRTREKKTG